MQDIDFYNGRNNHQFPPHVDGTDPEYFTRMTKNVAHEQDRNRKKASRLLFVIIALCIISFTTGLVLGIKFAGDSRRELIDNKTYTAMTDISKRVSDIIQKQPESNSENIYPKKIYPYVIKIGDEYAQHKTREISQYLSRKGHTIILSKNNENFRIYVGPYKSDSDAENALQAISSYNYNLLDKAKVIQRL